MFPRINPTTTKSWSLLEQHASKIKEVHMKELFAQDPNRFDKFSFRFQDTVFDFSKNLVTEETMRLLLQLAEECKLEKAIEAMFAGDFINTTQHRTVLHVA